jgi:hypothetical protein
MPAPEPNSLAHLLPEIRDAVAAGRVLWKRHALEKMLERGIARGMVIDAIGHGQIIEAYPDDFPAPSMLFCTVAPEPLHVVVAWTARDAHCHIITAYRPDLAHFEPGFLRRRTT